MDLQEWKAKQSQKVISQYTHFDRRISLESCFEYISSPQKVSHHGFYPFIHHILKSRKVKAEPKKRNIYYAAHMDSWIYRYYAYLINERYNCRVKKDNINMSSVAYRTDLKMSNVQFARIAFDFIRQAGSCYVMIGDFKDFFDNLNHKHLKQQLCDLLSVTYLPDDFYAVYKNVTQFAYVELQDLLHLNGLKDNKKDRKKFNSHEFERALPIEQFRQHKDIVQHNPKGNRGIPQGSPISAVLANVYMLKTDKQIQEYVSSFGGFYMRYSDDFIVILPKSEVPFSQQYKTIKGFIKDIDVTLQEAKTKIFCYENEKVVNCSSEYTGIEEGGKNIIDFLGFSFNGKQIQIRDRTVSRYYNKMYRKAKTIVKNRNSDSGNQYISAKNLYKQYSYKGSRAYLKKMSWKKGVTFDEEKERGNFLDYVLRAEKEFPRAPVNIVAKRHMSKIHKCLNKPGE